MSAKKLQQFRLNFTQQDLEALIAQHWPEETARLRRQLNLRREAEQPS